MSAFLARRRSGAAQVCRVAREGITRGKETVEIVCAMTGPSPERAGPSELPALSRAHWATENCPRHVRDVTCREDHQRANAGSAPQVLAAFRNTVPTLMRRLGHKVVEGFEYFAEHRPAAIEAVRGQRTQ